MKHLLTHIGISRQALHQGYHRMIAREDHALLTCQLADKVRINHPGMSCRDIYHSIADKMPRGRDWSEQTLLTHGYGIKRPSRSFTQSGKDSEINLIEGLPVTRMHQIWQTDITYVWSAGRWYYVSFIVDVYTRKILAWHCSKDLSSTSQLRCLQKAVTKVRLANLAGLIVHTDRGVQYTSGEYKGWLSDRQLRLSMARYAYENAYCERVHRTIKHNYLKYYQLDSFQKLKQGVARAVKMYNSSKPHCSLPGRRSPNQFIKEQAQGKYPEYNFKIWSKLTSTKNLNVN